MKLFIGLALSAVLVSAQSKFNLIQIIPPPGTGGIGRVDFFDPTNTFSTHVTASTTLGQNNSFQFPKNTLSASVGQCLTITGVSQGVTEWAACNSTLVPPVTISGTNGTFILSLTQSGTGNALSSTSVNGRAGFFQNTGNTIALEGANTGSEWDRHLRSVEWQWSRDCG